MSAPTIIAMALVIPVILIPAVLVWYVNFGGILATIREARSKKAATKTSEKSSI